MPLYWDNKALPTPTQYVIFLIIFLFLNKCLSDAIWDSKRKKIKVCQKADSIPGRSLQNEYDTRFKSVPLELTVNGLL